MKDNNKKIKLKGSKTLTPNQESSRFRERQKLEYEYNNEVKEDINYKSDENEMLDVDEEESVESTDKDSKDDEMQSKEDDSDDEKDSEDEEDSDDDDNKSEDGEENQDNKVDPNNRRDLQPDRKPKEDIKSQIEKDSKKPPRLPGVGGKKEVDEDSKTEKIKHTAEVAQRNLQRAGRALMHLVKLVLNPIFWIIIAVLIIIAFIASTQSIVGKTDYNIECDSQGVGGVSLDSDADDFTRQSAIASWLTSTPFDITGGKPLNREQAMGIMGNLMEESYGANNFAIQNDHSKEKWKTCDNNCVLAWGNADGKGIGIVQWDTGRRIKLVKFAISEGTQWHDLNTQLKYLKSEMDSGYDSDQLVKGGFHDMTKSIDEYTKIWNVWFERSGASGTPAGDNPRIKKANDFAALYTGGSGGSSGGGLSSNCLGGGMGSVDTSNLIQLAIASAWPNRNDSLGSCPQGYTNCGLSFAKPEYIAAKEAAEAATGQDPLRGLFASCDRYVATMLRATGTDPNFPWGDTGLQGNYLRNNKNGWQKISCQDRQPGDVLWRPGHIMLYLGNVNGKDSLGSASHKERTAAINPVSCSGSRFNADGKGADGWRKVR